MRSGRSTASDVSSVDIARWIRSQNPSIVIRNGYRTRTTSAVAWSIDRSWYGSSFTSVRVAQARNARMTRSFTSSISTIGKPVAEHEGEVGGLRIVPRREGLDEQPVPQEIPRSVKYTVRKSMKATRLLRSRTIFPGRMSAW